MHLKTPPFHSICLSSTKILTADENGIIKDVPLDDAVALTKNPLGHIREATTDELAPPLAVEAQVFEAPKAERPKPQPAKSKAAPLLDE